MITLTELAAKRVREQLAKRGRGLGIRVGVKTTGCSGLAYVLEYIDRFDDTMAVVESHDVLVWIDPQHIPYIEGTVIDWVRQGLNEGFEFANAKEKGRCGCGESFRI